jgi:hypothetical protein
MRVLAVVALMHPSFASLEFSIRDISFTACAPNKPTSGPAQIHDELRRRSIVLIISEPQHCLNATSRNNVVTTK